MKTPDRKMTDAQRRVQQAKRAARTMLVRDLLEEGRGIEEVATLLGVNVRTVYRDKKAIQEYYALSVDAARMNLRKE